MPVYQSAGVYVVEKDLSQVVPTTSTSVGAIVLHAKRGEIGKPVLVTNTQEYINNFGNPHPSNGFGAYAALAFLERSSQLYVVRVVEGAYAYAGVKCGINITSGRPTTTVLGGFSGGINPDDVDFGTVVAPTITSATVTTTSGTLPVGTYQYQVTAVNAYGQESTALVATGATIALLTEQVAVTIARVDGAVSYNLYRQGIAPAVAQRFITSIAQPTTGDAVYVDLGAIVGTGTQSPPGSATISQDAFFVRAIGPGAYANTLKVAVTSTNLYAPTISTIYAPTITAPVTSTTGVLGVGTYEYRVTAVDALGNETAALAATSAVIAAPGDQVAVTITAVPGAASYKVYRAKTAPTAVASRLIATVTAPTVVYVDLGAVVGSGTQTPPAGTGTLAAATYYYKATAVNSLGQETDALAGVASTVSLLGVSPVIMVTRVEGAAYYKIYGRPATIGGTYLYLGSVTQPSTGNASFTDGGTVVGTTATIPSANYTLNNEFRLSIFDTSVSSSQPIEEYDVTMVEKLDGFGQQMDMETRVNTFSKAVRVVKNTAYTDTNGQYGLLSVVDTSASGGADGDAYSSISAGAFTAGWDQFVDPEKITVRILIEGGTQQAAIQLKMNQIALARKDCVAILDIPTSYQDATQAVVYRRDVLNMNSNRAAIYTPDLKINDPYNDLVIYVPPSGYVGAVYAFTDFSAQVWYAPAGLNRGTLNVLGVRYKYNQAERDLLAPSQINYVRNFPGLGIAVWEQTTLQSKTSALSFVNVRRMLDIIEVSVSQALLFSNFEPNDDFLKRQIVTLIAQFLEVIKNGRGIADYAVISDSSNNPPQIANQGQLNVDVYIQPILPARVIQLQMIITKQGVSFQELIASGGNV